MVDEGFQTAWLGSLGRRLGTVCRQRCALRRVQPNRRHCLAPVIL